LQADVEALPDDREAAYQEAVASMTNWDASRADAYVPRSDRRAGPPVMRSAIQLTLESPNPDPQVVELMQRLHQLTADALGGRAVRLIRATDGAASFDDTTNSWWSYFPYEGSSSATTSWTNELFGATDFGSDFWFTEVDDQHVLFREGTIEHEFLVVTDSEVLDRLMVGPSAAPFMRPTDQSDLQVDLLALPPGEEVRGSGTREWFEREILPQRLLHMTNASRIASIAEHGIDPARGAMMSSPEAAPRPGVVYLANESKFDGGLSGNLGVDLLGLSEPVTLEIDPTKLDYSRFVPDEDDFTFMGDAAKRDAFGLPPYSDDQNPGQWARDANLGTQPGIMDALSATGPYPTSSYGYGGVIPPEAITRVRFEEGWSDTLRDWTEESDWMTLDEAVVEARRRFMDERVEASEEASDQAIDLLRRGTVTAPDGARPATPEDRERLKIPPGWVDVFVADDPTNYRQVWARDAQGRSQGRYTAEYEARQEALKFERVKELAAKLDDLDNALVRDMMTDSAAAVTALIRHFGLRPGSMKDTRARKQAYGATTLQARHVRQYPDTGRTTLSFVGKSGQKITVSTRDPDIYRLMQHWTDGKQGTDFLFEATDADVRAYLTGAIGPGFLAKDLRTLKANVMALEMVRSMRRPTTMTAFRKARNKVADAVAKALGNTRAVTLSGYINPTVFADWEDRLL
jgi:DNA topoisomerase-1